MIAGFSISISLHLLGVRLSAREKALLGAYIILLRFVLRELLEE